MDSALLASGSEKGLHALRAMLDRLPLSRVLEARSGSEARRFFGAEEFAVAVINAPLQGELGPQLALWIAENSSTSVLLLLRQEQADALPPAPEEKGVLVLEKPLNTQAFLRALRLMLVEQHKLQELREQNLRLQEKIEETRLVGRAKCALIEKQGLTEPQAHRLIEKRAMDQRLPKREVAREILEALDGD